MIGALSRAAGSREALLWRCTQCDDGDRAKRQQRVDRPVRHALLRRQRAVHLRPIVIRRSSSGSSGSAAAFISRLRRRSLGGGSAIVCGAGNVYAALRRAEEAVKRKLGYAIQLKEKPLFEARVESTEDYDLLMGNEDE